LVPRSRLILGGSRNLNQRLFISICLSLVIHILILGLLKLSESGSQQAKPRLKAVYFDVYIEQSNTLVAADKVTVQQQFIPQSTEASLSNDLPEEVQRKSSPNNQLSLMPAELHYYKIKELDVKPEMISEINTKPAELASHKQGGEIKIQIWIDERGNVVKSEMLSSNLPQAFIDYTIANFNQSKFTAGIKDGVPVRSVAKVVVQFAATN
jgi:hypothetical protein